ncbi:MAG: TonB-dependent receptor plug domain-containing protein, partial [Acidimicrobiales bacterium]
TPLGGIRVFAPLERGRPLAVTDLAGAFVLELPARAVRLVAAGIGFAPETLEVAAARSVVEFRLTAAPVALDPVAVTAERAYSTASSDVIRELDVRLRPRESSQELLRLAPGLVIAQHAGGGKAEQIFLRGFDVDHGTDVAISVDGTPVNMVSHAHGQGYADLHFLSPQIVERADVRKGPYNPRDGDLATAGAVAFRTRDRLAGPETAARGGSFGTAHVLALLPVGGGADRSGGYVALAGQFTDGPFEQPQGYWRYNVFGKWTAPLGGGLDLRATASSFAGRWDASGQIPTHAVANGTIGRYGSIDPSEGGETARHEVSVGLRSRGMVGPQWDVQAYAVRYRLQLYSNFTFFLEDSIRGDGIEQRDGRWQVGGQGTYVRDAGIAGRAGRLSLGAGVRSDFADVALYHQQRRTRLEPRVEAEISQQHLFGWGAE